MHPIEKDIQDYILRGFLPLMMLQLIRNNPTHGGELLRILSLTGVTKAGPFYKTLSSLRWSGMIKETAGISPKGRGVLLYSLTNEGDELLKRNTKFVHDWLKLLKS